MNIKVETFMLIVCLIFLPQLSQATRLLVGTVTIKQLQENGCFQPDDFNRLGITKYKGGVQANYHNEHDLVELLTKLYGCSIMEDEAQKISTDTFHDGIVYFLHIKNMNDDGSLWTLFDTLNYPIEWGQKMPSKMQLYQTVEDVVASEGYLNLSKEYDKEDILIQAIDIVKKQDIGLYDYMGQKVQ